MSEKLDELMDGLCTLHTPCDYFGVDGEKRLCDPCDPSGCSCFYDAMTHFGLACAAAVREDPREWCLVDRDGCYIGIGDTVADPYGIQSEIDGLGFMNGHPAVFYERGRMGLRQQGPRARAEDSRGNRRRGYEGRRSRERRRSDCGQGFAQVRRRGDRVGAKRQVIGGGLMFDGKHCGICDKSIDEDMNDVCFVTVQRFSGESRQFFVCSRCADEFEDLAKNGELVMKPPREWE